MKKLLTILLATTLSVTSWAKSDSSLERLGDEMANVLDGSKCIKSHNPDKVNRRHFRDFQVAENNPHWFKARYEVPKGFVSSGHVYGYLMYNPVTMAWACGSLNDDEKHDKKAGITGWDDASGSDAYKAFQALEKSGNANTSTSPIKLKHKHHKVKIDTQANTLTLKSKGSKPFSAMNLINNGERLEFGFQASNDWYKPKGTNFVYFETTGLSAHAENETAVIQLTDADIVSRLVTALGDKKYLYLAVRKSGEKGFFIARVKR